MAKTQLGVRIEESLKAAVDKIAKAERRPLASQIELIIEEWLTARMHKHKPRDR